MKTRLIVEFNGLSDEAKGIHFVKEINLDFLPTEGLSFALVACKGDIPITGEAGCVEVQLVNSEGQANDPYVVEIWFEIPFGVNDNNVLEQEDWPAVREAFLADGWEENRL